MKISVLQVEAFDIAEEKGFHAGRTASRDDTLVRLCLIHSEVSEAVQEVKRGWMDNLTPEERANQRALREKVGEELADVLIRCADLAECIGVDLQEHVIQKLKKNRARPTGYGTPHEGTPGGI